MAHGPTLPEYLVRLETVSRTRELWDLTLAFCRSRGVARVSFHHYGLDAPNPHALPGFTIATDGFPDDWVAHYLREELWREDPIPRLAMQEGRMLRWGAVLDDPAVAERAPRFVAALREADIGDGVAAPLIGPALRRGYLGLGFLPGAALPPAQALAELQAAAQMAHLRYCRIVAARAAERRAITPREREVLHWIMQGKSTSVIADILSVSRHTIDTLTRRLFDKLEVADRTSAAIRAVELDLASVR